LDDSEIVRTFDFQYAHVISATTRALCAEIMDQRIQGAEQLAAVDQLTSDFADLFTLIKALYDDANSPEAKEMKLAVEAEGR